MSEAKRRSAASRPGKAGDGGRQHKRPAGQRREAERHDRTAEEKAATVESEAGEADDSSAPTSISESIAAAAEYQSEQRLGSAARRAAILAAVVCVLTLTIAGPVRTYFAQRTEMKQLAATEAVLRQQIAELEQQKQKLADPAYIAAQARDRLGFVMPGDVPYQVQLPPGSIGDATDAESAEPGAGARPGEPWYTSLWRTVADPPHSAPTNPVPPPLPPPAPGG